MADLGIKKIRIRQENFPSIDVNEQGYILRYRIVSDDKNRVSQWSPINIIVPDYDYVSGSIEFHKAGNIASVAWDSVSIQKDGNEIRKAKEYDIWLMFDRNDGGDWIYKERIEGTSISFPIPNTYSIAGIVQGSPPNRVTIEIYVKGNPITRDSNLLLVYEDGPHTV